MTRDGAQPDARAVQLGVGDIPQPLHEDNWRCPYCCWEGETAPMNFSRWEMECPECGGVIDDTIARTLEEHFEWSRGGRDE